MRLTQQALEKITDKTIRAKLCLALKVTDQSIIKYIKANNDELTKAAALKVIREETGLEDSEILEESEEKEVAA
jgi:hypothetical protein